MELISVNDLSLQREGYFAFKHVAFSLSQNEIVGISGENGSGKTQLLETIANYERADSGKIKYTPGVRIGYMPQNDPQIVEQTVRKYLEDIRRLSKNLAVRKDQLDAMVTYMKLAPYLDRTVDQLSLGLKRRVSFLAAVVGHPNVLLLDEPFAFQSNETVQNMLSMLQDLKDNGSGILLVGTEENGEISEILDSSYHFENGKLRQLQSLKTKNSQLFFSVHHNSIALTHDLSGYMIRNTNGVVEMKVPLDQRDTIIGKMIALNYQFEEAHDIEN
ncbi:Vitamin B12 import ATP-binding protein BtuD [Companilactobacillus paralimentarius]|uniref:ATP-binding cassette domain-containing protein n=1 Tax=Companilactobacillus paralimentarius TaxID=83526 RepID=UPI00384D2DEC